MNDLTFEVLNVLYDYCPDDSYKIIDINDIILALPEGISTEPEHLFIIIDDLVTEEAVALKYRDEEDICIAMLAKGRRIVKKERETRAKIEAQKRAKEEEEARQRALKEAEERERREREERERLEKIEKEKKLEEARLALQEMQSQKKKKEAVELKQQVIELEKEIEQIEQAPEAEVVITQADNKEKAVVISSAENLDIMPIIKKVGKVAFWGGLMGAIIGNGLFLAAKFIMTLIGG